MSASDCADRLDDLFLLAADALEGEERERLEAHLQEGCPTCETRLDRAREALAATLLTLEPVEPPARIRRDLVARASHGDDRAAAPRRRSGWGMAAAAAALALVLGTGLGAWLARQPTPDPPDETAAADPEERIRELEEMIDEADEELSELGDDLELAQEMLVLLRSDHLVRVALAGQGEHSDARGTMFWEWEDEYTCFVHVLALPPAPPEREHVAWLADDAGDFVRVGALAPDDEGASTVFAKLPAEPRRVVRVIVSEEPASAPGEAPTGPVLLAATL